MKTNEFYLPILDKVTIYDYSLYKCPFEIDFSSKLNIIYGTNGIGKSTLLMIILFSIIGPYKGTTKTQIRLEKRRDSRPLYYPDFFKDRMITVSEKARVISEFHINKSTYKVSHSLYDGSLLEVMVNQSDYKIKKDLIEKFNYLKEIFSDGSYFNYVTEFSENNFFAVHTYIPNDILRTLKDLKKKYQYRL